jgi:hypothetical protein
MDSLRATGRESISAARRQKLDGNRFDKLAVSLAGAGSSRRSLLARFAGGGFAAALAALGIGGLGAEDAEAKKKAKSCPKKCNKKAKKKDWSNKKKKACKEKCKKKAAVGTSISNNAIFTGTTTPIGGTCTVGAAGGNCAVGTTCVLNASGAMVCAPSDQVKTCTANSQCPTGFCASVGICLPCGTLGTTICGSGTSQTCCAVGVSCNPNLDICLA